MIHTFSYFPIRCGPCKLLGPRLDSVMKKHMDSVLLAKVDVDEMEELAMQLNVSSIDQSPASTHFDRIFYAIWEERQLT